MHPTAGVTSSVPLARPARSIAASAFPRHSSMFFAVSLFLLPPSVASAANLRAFLTSTTGTGNLGTWPESGGHTGLQAADVICAARANAAGMSGSFVAWMSDDGNDAYCRAAGLGGTLSNHCGQASTPVAGPWVRLDGAPFADTIDEALSSGGGHVYSRLTDESGHEATTLSSTYSLATGTTFTGENASNQNCSNWSSAAFSVNGMMGDAIGTTDRWTNVQTSSCSSRMRLLCLEAGAGSPLPSFPTSTHRQMFVSTSTGSGQFSSWVYAAGASAVAAADNVCVAEATAAHLYRPDTFKAYVSDNTPVHPQNAIDRFHFDGPWERVDGLLFAHGVGELAGATSIRPPNVTADGHYLGGLVYAWTGTDSGSADVDTCSDPANNSWNTTSGLGFTGPVSGSGLTLYDSTPDFCSHATHPLYCFSDADTVFHYGFEP